MAVFKVWLTVKDHFGHTKEVDGGNIEVSLDGLSPDDVKKVEAALPLHDYLKKEEVDQELDRFATDHELEEAVDAKDTLKYSGFIFSEEPGGTE